ncbi:MAG: hypothetical protein ACI37Z_10410 [Candidatus Gastranaerophilaceae bacterium]
MSEININKLFSEDIHTEVEEALKKNVVTDEDIEKYNLNKKTSLAAGEFIDLLNQAFDTDVDARQVAQEVLSENISEDISEDIN